MILPAWPCGSEDDLSNLTLSNALRIALHSNKDIRIAAREPDAAEARVTGAKGEFDPNLFLEATYDESELEVADIAIGSEEVDQGRIAAGARKRNHTGTDLEIGARYDHYRFGGSLPSSQQGTRVALILSQDLLKDFGLDINRTEIRVAQNDTRISAETLRDTMIQTVFEVEKAYWDLFFSMADLDVRRLQLQRAKDLVTRAELQVEAGEAPPIEITRAQSGAATQAVAILDAKNLIAKLRNRLLERMGILKTQPPDAPLQLSDDPPQGAIEANLNDARATAAHARPDLVQAELRIENARLRQHFTRNQRLPRLRLLSEVSHEELDANRGSSREFRNDEDLSWGVGVLMEVPWPNREARADHLVSRIEHDQAITRAEALREQIEIQVRDAFEDLRTTEGRIEAAGEAHELALRLLEAEETSFKLGRTDSLNVLNAQAVTATAERDRIRARTDYASALANFYRVRGDLLEQKKIRFETGREG